MPRPDGRKAGELRPVKITPDFIGSADGSVLIEVGRTRVVCTATVEAGVRVLNWPKLVLAALPRTILYFCSSSTPARMSSRSSRS